MLKPKVVALIPARGGSKGIFRKNVRNLAGKPLIAWTVDAALKAKCIDEVVVSTEDEEIADIAEGLGACVPFMRPKELAMDESTRNEVVMHAVNALPACDHLILLQPTSPLRSSSQICEAYELFLHSQSLSCVSVTEQCKSPQWMFELNDRNEIIPLLPPVKDTNRQASPKYYFLNGAIYISSKMHLTSSIEPDPFLGNNTIAYLMSRRTSVDIDDEDDWEFVEHLITKGMSKSS